MTVDTCWKDRFSPTRPPCTQPGVWASPPDAQGRNIAPTFVDAIRWCDVHRSPDDVHALV